MDDAAAADQEPEAPAMTLARTRELLTRSRATLDMLTRRLQASEERPETLSELVDELQV